MCKCIGCETKDEIYKLKRLFHISILQIEVTKFICVYTKLQADEYKSFHRHCLSNEEGPVTRVLNKILLTIA